MAKFSLLSKNPDNRWTQIMIIVTLIFIITIVYKRMYNPDKYEGFEQSQPYVVMRDEQIYDEFYVAIHDVIHKPDRRADFEIGEIIRSTQPSPEYSIFLDVGSGTGYLTNELHRRGFTVYGLDKSQVMIDHAQTAYPNLNLTCGDAMMPMMFDRGSFSHVICSYMTIYQFADKREFFRNCYFWLKMGGYLILHLVDREKFDLVMPAGQSHLLTSPQQYADRRITDTDIDFVDFRYHSSYKFTTDKFTTDKFTTDKFTTDKPDSADTVVLHEKMTDTATGKVRENEQMLYMDTMNGIVNLAKYCGFILHGQANMEKVGDKYQSMFIFERPM